MSFLPVSPDDLRCRTCSAEITLAQYRRLGLCEECEALKLMSMPWRCPDTPPEWLTARESA